MKVLLGSLTGLIAFVALAACASAGVQSIWAASDGDKVKRDDLAHHARQANSVWDGHRVSMVAARNEIVAFQVIVEADQDGIEELAISLDRLRTTSGGAAIRYRPPGEDPSNYVGRDIEIFTQNYMHITRPSQASWVFRPGTPAAPQDWLGWVPVQLVPENATPGRGGMPVKVEPRQNQAFWIDIYTRRDLPAGMYYGSVRVCADGESIELPVELEVYDFTLPDEGGLPTMVYYEPYQPELYQGQNLDARYHRFARRNRVELVHRYDERSAVSARGRFTGEDFTRANGYEGPGEGLGNRIIPASFYSPIREYSDRDFAWRHSDRWMTFLAREFPNAITFMYMPDEPRPARYPEIIEMAANIHSNPGPGGNLPVFVTKRVVEELDGSIDIWCAPVGGNNVEAQAAQQALGREVWVYNGGRPGGGSIIIDAPATDARATIWACFKHGIDGYFYWHGVHWHHNSQKQGERLQNVWGYPVTFDNRYQPGMSEEDRGGIMGDGVLMYPGTDVQHPEQDRGIMGPISTIQLANFRRGLQDYLYLAKARELGLDDAVDEALERIVPKVFSEAEATVSFPQIGDPYEEVRRELAVKIAEMLREREGRND